MQVVQFDSEIAWAHSIAHRWCERLRATPSLRMCLPAGHTPVPVYAEMVKTLKAGLVSFGQAEVFTLDEFGELAPDDPGRCAQQLRRSLIDHVDLRLERCHFLRTEAADLADECRLYDEAIGGGFDLTLLGIGLNGHLGMNEPGTSVGSTTHRAELHASTVAASHRYLTHTHAPAWGVTVGMKHLLESREVWLLACGANKAEIVRRTLRGAITPEVPSSMLRRHQNCFLFVDAAAGAGL
jgi:glucosamine-6-phosphate isomerase